METQFGISPLELTEADKALVQAAKDIITKLHKRNRHAVGSAIRTKQGKIYTAVHLETLIGRTAVCAEAIALGKAISEEETEFDVCVAVRYDEEKNETFVVSPCGMCREMLTDYHSDIKIIVSHDKKLVKCKLMDLLPMKFSC